MSRSPLLPSQQTSEISAYLFLDHEKKENTISSCFHGGFFFCVKTLRAFGVKTSLLVNRITTSYQWNFIRLLRKRLLRGVEHFNYLRGPFSPNGRLIVNYFFKATTIPSPAFFELDFGQLLQMTLTACCLLPRKERKKNYSIYRKKIPSQLGRHSMETSI